jgi:hypothetical protein
MTDRNVQKVRTVVAVILGNSGIGEENRAIVEPKNIQVFTAVMIVFLLFEQQAPILMQQLTMGEVMHLSETI